LFLLQIRSLKDGFQPSQAITNSVARFSEILTGSTLSLNRASQGESVEHIIEIGIAYEFHLGNFGQRDAAGR